MDSRDRGRALDHRKTIWIKCNPKELHRSLGLHFCLFGYKRGCRVTATDLRLQNLECGYRPPGRHRTATADCIHKCHYSH